MNDDVKIYSAKSPAEYAPVSLSARALSHIKAQMTKRGSGLGVRLGTKNSGCSDMSYVFDFVDEQQADDVVFACDDAISLFVSRKSLPFLSGTVIDYVTEGLNSKLVFNNPQAVNTCGCGESFGVKP
jgi:iron-sulfur cluster assembly protein